MTGAIGIPAASHATETPAPAASAAPAALAALTTEVTPLGDLLDSAPAKAVLEVHIPKMLANPQIEMARGMTLKQLQTYAGDELTDAVLAKIDADLAKLPAAK